MRITTTKKIPFFVIAIFFISNFLFAQNEIDSVQNPEQSLEVKVKLMAAQMEEFKIYDDLRPKGITIPYPPTMFTAWPTVGGLRKPLADAGIGISGFINGAFTYDMLGNEGTQQIYNGQEPTFSTTNFFNITYDLNRIGLPKGSQLFVQPSIGYSQFDYASVNKFVIGQLSIFIPLFDNRVEVLGGYVRTMFPFYGIVIGSNQAQSALGPFSSIPVNVGMSTFAPAPYLGIKTFSKNKKWYNNIAITRSLSPEGLFADRDLRNSVGLEWEIEDAKPLIVNEIGFKQMHAQGQKYIWTRIGGIYNTTKYNVFGKPLETKQNYGLYFVSDIQFTQNPIIPHIGWYINVKSSYAPEDINLYSQDSGITLYKIGTFNNRPGDVFSVAYGSSSFSDASRTSLSAFGIESEHVSNTLSMSYACLVSKGFVINPQISYTDNPTFTPKNNNALLGTLSMSILF